MEVRAFLHVVEQLLVDRALADDVPWVVGVEQAVHVRVAERDGVVGGVRDAVVHHGVGGRKVNAPGIGCRGASGGGLIVAHELRRNLGLIGKLVDVVLLYFLPWKYAIRDGMRDAIPVVRRDNNCCVRRV